MHDNSIINQYKAYIIDNIMIVGTMDFGPWLLDFGPTSPFKRPERIKAQSRPKYPNTDTDLGLKTSL